MGIEVLGPQVAGEIALPQPDERQAFVDGAARFQCLKEIPAPIASKTKFNECALYAPSVTLALRGRSAQPSPDAARSAFDALFRK